ncbi:MAG TPA: S41 family peptidase [Pyrinomonadaceae bacterium]
MAENETGAGKTLEEIERAEKIIELNKFLPSVEKKSNLSRTERLRIVDQAILLFEMNYVHLPLKRAMHAINPIQRLKLLKFRLETKGSEMETGLQFHKRLLDIFASLRDLHTVYLLPTPFRDHTAFLPFLVEQYFARVKGKRVEKFLVSRVLRETLPAAPDQAEEVASFEPGVEVLYWNGILIRRVIELNGETQAGSNLEARFARGLDNLTVRPLDTSLPPDENWVDLTYQTRTKKILTLRLEWLVYQGDAKPLSKRITKKKRAAIDIKKTKINQLKRTLFGPPVRDLRVRKEFEDVFYAEVRPVDGRDFGYIRLFSFDPPDTDEFVKEFRRVITKKGFPQEGLIIDVRGNPGGKIRSGERLLQLFTPRRIRPESFEFINSSLNLEICRKAPKRLGLLRWADSIAEAVITGATYSLGFPISSDEDCNGIGQVYYGPVLLITDALSYSTTDMFAAGFQDNEIGDVLGTSDNTGAGGANVWWYDDFINAAAKNSKSPFKALPRDTELMVAIRRSIRVGRRDGRPLEELGIAPDHRHYMTKNDLLKRNVDLVKRAAAILNTKPIYSLSLRRVKGQDRALNIVATSTVRPRGKRKKILARDKHKRISRLDISVNGCPYKSLSARDGAIRRTKVTFPKAVGRIKLLVQAFDHRNDLVVSYRNK